MSGTLTFQPSSASLKRDTEVFGTMDPYIKFHFGTVMIKTKPCTDGGKHPTWKEKLTAKRTTETMITFDLWDKDYGKDDIIAQGSYNLTSVLTRPNQNIVESLPLTYKGKPAGTLNVTFSFTPDGHYPQQQQGFNMPPQQQQGFNMPPQQQQGFNMPPQQQQGFNMPPQQQQGFNMPPQQQQGFNMPPQQFNAPPQQFNQPNQQHFNAPPQQFNQPPQQNFNAPPQQFNQPNQQHFNAPPQQFNQPHQQFNQPPQQQFNQYPQQFNQPPGGQQKFMGKYPMITFNSGCKKCHGQGISKKKNKPCGKCYETAGYCKKCCGSMWNIKKNERCTKCHNGRA